MSEKQTQTNENDMTRMAYEMQALRGRLEELQRQAAAIQQIADGAQATIEALSQLSGAKEAVFQLGAGAMMKATPAGTVLVDVGSGVIAEKKPAEAQKIMEERARQANAALQQIQKAVSETVARINNLGERAEALRGQAGEEGGFE